MTNQPVAWHYPDGKPDQCTTNKEYAEKEPAWTPMYYKHEWVGLTEDEIDQIIEMGLGVRDSIETALDKLKEKNNG